ncbi:MAG: hypothetical protein NTU53_03140 [Planctomycetota bacterium]|nr:hypothetical protein [Planctomycetota bacterium]
MYSQVGAASAAVRRCPPPRFLNRLWTWGLDKLLKWLITLLPAPLRQCWTIR